MPARRAASRARQLARGRGGERGSVLMLMPAAVLIMVVLGAIAVDSAVAFLGEREVANAAAAAANDAAGAALDVDVFYATGVVRLDQERARTVAGRSVRAGVADFLEGVSVGPVVVAGNTVTVTVTARVRYVFAAALPATSDTVRVEATATATAEERAPS